MKQKIIAFITLLVLLLAYISLVVYSNHSSPAPIANTLITLEPTEPVYFARAELKAQQDTAKYSLWSILVNGILAAGAFGAIWFSRKQWQEQKRQDRQVSRAYVGIKAIEYYPGLNGKPAYWKIQVINEGQTPAYEVKINSALCVLNFDTADAHYKNLVPINDDSLRFTLGPKAERAAFHHYASPFKDQDLYGMRNGTAGPFLVIHVLYKDAFGELHGFKTSGRHPEGVTGANRAVLTWLPEEEIEGY